MANRTALKAASERLRHVMDEVMELDPSGAAVMRMAYSVIYPDNQPLPIIFPPSNPPPKSTLGAGTAKAEAAATLPAPNSGSSSIGKATVEQLATKSITKPTTKPAIKAKPATKQSKVDEIASSSQKRPYTEDDSDSNIQFVSLLEPDIVKNLADARTQSTSTLKSKKRKVEKKAARVESKKLFVESDPFAKVDAIANDPKYSAAKKPSTQETILAILELPITLVKSKKK